MSFDYSHHPGSMRAPLIATTLHHTLHATELMLGTTLHLLRLTLVAISAAPLLDGVCFSFKLVLADILSPLLHASFFFFFNDPAPTKFYPFPLPAPFPI